VEDAVPVTLDTGADGVGGFRFFSAAGESAFNRVKRKQLFSLLGKLADFEMFDCHRILCYTLVHKKAKYFIPLVKGESEEDSRAVKKRKRSILDLHPIYYLGY
jgi:hypothetical protein